MESDVVGKKIHDSIFIIGMENDKELTSFAKQLSVQKLDVQLLKEFLVIYQLI